MRWKLLLGSLLMLAPVPALAQVTARYTAGKSDLTIQAMPDGDFRADIGPGSIVRIDGTDYVIFATPGAAPLVTKFQDVFALIRKEMEPAPVRPDTPPEGEHPLAGGDTVLSEDQTEARRAVPVSPPAPNLFKFALVAGGEEIVAGYAGRVWDWGMTLDVPGADPAAPSAKDRKQFVMSADPRLAPLAPAFKLGVEVLRAIAEPVFGTGGNFEDTMRQLFAQGVPIRVQQDVVLKSVEFGPIPADRFELPGPVMQAADFLAATGGPGAEPPAALPPLP